MSLRDLLHELVHEIGELKARIKVIEKHLEALAVRLPWLNDSERFPASVYRPPQLSSALWGDVARFASGRQFACYPGRTPREHSRGEQQAWGRQIRCVFSSCSLINSRLLRG